MSDDPVLAALARLEAGLGNVTSRMDRLEDGQTQLRTDLMERIDRLQHTVDSVKDDIVVTYGANDRIERIAKSASDETRALGEVVRAMQRQIKRLQTDVDQLRDGSSA
jgi:hypothetical protein